MQIPSTKNYRYWPIFVEGIPKFRHSPFFMTCSLCSISHLSAAMVERTDKQTERQTHWRTETDTDTRRDIQTDRHTDTWTDRDRQTHKLTGRDKQTDRQTDTSRLLYVRRYVPGSWCWAAAPCPRRLVWVHRLSSARGWRAPPVTSPADLHWPDAVAGLSTWLPTSASTHSLSCGLTSRSRHKIHHFGDVSPSQSISNKKLSCRRGTARCVVSIEILPIATQQCRNYLHDKSWPNRWYEQQQQQQRPFNGLWSGTTQVGRYQKKHSPTHTHPDHRASFITFLHLQRSMASSLFNLRAWQSSLTTSVQVLFGLPLGLEPSTTYSVHFFTQFPSCHCLCKALRSMRSRVYEMVCCLSVCPIRLLLQHAVGLLLWSQWIGDIDRLLHDQLSNSTTCSSKCRLCRVCSWCRKISTNFFS